MNREYTEAKNALRFEAQRSKVHFGLMHTCQEDEAFMHRMGFGGAAGWLPAGRGQVAG